MDELARFLGVSCDKAQLEGLTESCTQLIEQCSKSEALSVCRGEYERKMRKKQTSQPKPSALSSYMSVSLAATATFYIISSYIFTPFLTLFFFSIPLQFLPCFIIIFFSVSQSLFFCFSAWKSGEL